MSRRGILLAGLALCVMAHRAPALDLYIVRHAETLANVNRDYSVFNQRHFTEAGAQQVTALTEGLRGRRFDAILVSPAYRVLRTIEPYLEESGQVAEIWPELDECCWQSGDAMAASDTAIAGPSILVDQDMRPYFMLRAGSDDRVPSQETYEDGIARIQRAAELIRNRFGDSDQAVLVVDHWHAGARLIELLLGQAPEGRYRLVNGAVTWLHAEQGTFTLAGLNLPLAVIATNLPRAAVDTPAAAP